MLRTQPAAESELLNGDPATVAEARPALAFLSWGFEIRRFHVVRNGFWLASLAPDAALKTTFNLANDCVVMGYGGEIEFDPRTLSTAIPLGWGPVDQHTRVVVSTDPAAGPACSAWGAAKDVDIVLLRSLPAAEVQPDHQRQALHKALATFLWRRDRFEEPDPQRLRREVFGHSSTMSEILSMLSAGSSVAILGLRMIGKTSLLDAVCRQLVADALAVNAIARLDANSTQLRGGHWWTAAEAAISAWERSLNDTADQTGSKIRPKATEFKDHVAKRVTDGTRLAGAFERDVVSIEKAANALRNEQGRALCRLILIIDDCENLYPHREGANYWKSEFFVFWNIVLQIRGRLAAPGALVFLLAASDPSGVERGSILDQPNPLHGTHVTYVQPLSLEDAGLFLNGLGRRMGLAFAADAVAHVHEAVGGHPLLLRRFGSAVHRAESARTTIVTVNAAKAAQVCRKYRISFYDHMLWILNHLRESAPDEERLLRDIALGGSQAYLSSWGNNDLRDTYAQRLEGYGLVTYQGECPTIPLQLIRDAFQKPSANEFAEQKRRMKELVDSIELSLRMRLAVDLAQDCSQREAVEKVVTAIPADAKNRPLARQELIGLGAAHGLTAVLEAMNWGDYEILISKFYELIDWGGNAVARAQRLSMIKDTFQQAHLVRHNNDRELRDLVATEGFAALHSRFCGVRDMFSGQG